MSETNFQAEVAKQRSTLIPMQIVWPFILITILFPLWGFANDITNPMVKAFSKILQMSAFQGSLVQFAFYGGYFAMAFPAAMFIKRFSYKAGVLVGLGLYSTGALLFIPSSHLMIFWPFLISYFIITCGLSFLETSANPYILSMGPEETSTRRLNMSQAFNPVGSLLGMFTAQSLILARLNPATREERGAMPTEVLREVTAHDLGIIRGPYVAIALVIIVIFVLIVLTKMPAKADRDRSLNLGPTFKRLLTNKRYIHSVIAQFFYVGVQIMCWTFIIHYGTELFTSPGYDMTVQEAEVLSQKYNIAAMCIFCASRFVCTHLLKFICPGRLLMSLAIGGTALILGTIFVPGIVGLYCLVGASACMSLMFPTIYGIALTGLGDDAKLGAAGLIMAILGGSVMPPVQGAIIDLGTVGPLSAVRASFVVSLICFVVIVHFGRKTYRVYVTS